MTAQHASIELHECKPIPSPHYNVDRWRGLYKLPRPVLSSGMPTVTVPMSHSRNRRDGAASISGHRPWAYDITALATTSSAGELTRWNTSWMARGVYSSLQRTIERARRENMTIDITRPFCFCLLYMRCVHEYAVRHASGYRWYHSKALDDVS